MVELENKELRRKAEQLMADEVARVMSQREDDNLQWQGARSDLMEAVYMAFTSGRLQDEEGKYISFKDIAHKVCRVLHQRVPSNPYEMAARARRRKGFQRRPFIDRYILRISRQSDCSPLWEQVSASPVA